MATFESIRQPADVLDASPQAPLLSPPFPTTPLLRPCTRHPPGRSRPSFPPDVNNVKTSSNGPNDDNSLLPEDVRSRLSQYSLTPEPTRGHRKTTTHSLPKNKTQFIISLKEELKKHNIIPANFNKLGFFEELYKLLADDMWEIRNEATLLILDLLPYLKNDVDSCMSIVLPNLVPNLGDSRIRLQKSSVQLLRTYATVSKDKEGLVEDLVTYGINHKSKKISRSATLNVIHLITDDFSSVDLSYLAQALYKKVYDPDWTRVPRDRSDDGGNDDDEDVVISSRGERTASHDIEALRGQGGMQFGIIDDAIMEKIRHPTDWKTRSEGCEQLRLVVKSLDDITTFLPHLSNFLSLLDSLIDDNNFRISMTVLDIFRLLIENLDTELLTYLRQIVHSVVKHVGDSKVVVRIENMKVFQKLLQNATPAAVIPILCDNLGHKSSRVREDCLNFIIYALMTFPSYEFDLVYLAEKVSVSVVDPKRRVRQAALECVAAIAQFLGPAKLGPLMAAVDRIEDNEEMDGVMEAVQARLARRQLPRVTPDGLIEYSLVVPSASKRNNRALPKGADVDWVLAGSGSITPANLSVSGSFSSSLSASFTASDSYVNTLAYAHPQSSPSPRPRAVTHEESLHRKRSFSDVALNRADERGLALWTTDTLDLSRTAPSDLGGYRGVYLGKLRQGSSYTRGINVDKVQQWLEEYNILVISPLPNKYGGGNGLQRFGERPAQSPSLHRRINALAPLDQGDNLVTVSRAGSRSVIPPLSAVSRRSAITTSKQDSQSDPDDELDEEEKSEGYYYEENEDEEEEIEEEEVEEEVLAEDDTVSRPKSSATTRDSGISVFSASNDGDDFTENGKDEAKLSAKSMRDAHRLVQAKGSTSFVDDHGRSSYDIGVSRGRKVGDLPSPSTHSLPNESLRNTGFGVVGKNVGGGMVNRSRNTPGSEKEFRHFDYESDFETDEEDPNNITLANTTLTKMKLLKKKRENLKEIERRRQERDNKRTQEERARKYRQLELQHSQDSLQPSRASSSESNLAVRPNLSYRGRNPTSIPHPNSQSNIKPSPRPSPRPSPSPNPPVQQTIPKSKSHNSNFSKSVGRGGVSTEKRHRSLERHDPHTNAAHTRETFRTPQLVKRGQPPAGGSSGNNLSNSLGSSGGTTSFTRRHQRRLPEKNSKRVEVSSNPSPGQPRLRQEKVRNFTPPDKSSPVAVGQQRPQLKHHLAPQLSAESRSSDHISSPMISVGLRTSKPASSCFKAHLEPFAHPGDALKKAHQQLSSGDWENQVDGIDLLVRLNEHHPEVLQSNLHMINLELLKQAKNLRSQVSRAAIQAFTRLFDTMKRSMESDSEKIVSVLLHRSADTNKFLQLDSHHALDALVENISPSKSIPAIIQEGLSHKNAAVRTTLARLLAYEVERLGPGRVLSGQKDITERILPAAAKLAQEGSLETRQYAKQIFQLLIQQGQFDAALKKYVSSNEIQNIQKFLDNLTSEGRTIHESARSKYGTGSRYTRTM
ncbi:TOG array regulator of axonemal microtubules protein 1-like [Homarus americanus]|uniref:TOG array regulator of axonemal microtubules protein 1-like n=1 Tax=Homarus americanus TaxID=6706 RepID=UPI001C48A2A4|nr:TOG array regulator of axonemal microtubules protein 1-like [Homarus americanus]